MIYTDTLHVVADTLDELVEFANLTDLEYFSGMKQGHPYFKIQNSLELERVLQAGAQLKPDKEALKIAEDSYK